MANKKNTTLTYNEDSIKVQKFPENVRNSPTMYISNIGDEGNLHLLREIYNNSIDEYLNGYGKKIIIEVSLNKGIFKVTDEGRGIPSKSIVKAFSTLHASGKFSDSGAYSTAGGLHGVGATVTNALSKYFLVTTHENGHKYTQKFEYGIKTTELLDNGKSDKKGTIIEFSPDKTIMETISLDFELLKEEIEMQSYVNKGLLFIVRDVDKKAEFKYFHKDGILEYVVQNAKAAIFDPFEFSSTETVIKNDKTLDIGVEISFTYNNTTEPLLIRSFTNSILNIDGGQHVQGFKTSLTNLIKKYIVENNMLSKKDQNLEITSDAIQEGVVAIVSIKHPGRPQYDQQSKKKLNSTEVSGAVIKAMNENFSKWLESHPKEMKKICIKVIESAKANHAAKRAKELANKKSESGITAVSDLSKLANCISKKPEECELFVVEGNSASSSSRNGRDKNTQAVYALRGKILNTNNLAETKIFENKELSDLIYILTGKKTAIGKNFNVEDMRYHKLVILTDAD